MRLRVVGSGPGCVTCLQPGTGRARYWLCLSSWASLTPNLSHRFHLVLPWLALSVAAVLVAPAHAATGEDDAVFFRRAASCVAVLERDAVSLAGRYRAGERAVKPSLVKLTEQGFSFIGRAYLRGLRKDEADRLTEEAKQVQQTMPADALRQLSTGCQAEGTRLYADAGSLEQMLVSNRARARVDKLLAKK